MNIFYSLLLLSLTRSMFSVSMKNSGINVWGTKKIDLAIPKSIAVWRNRMELYMVAQ